MTIEPIQPKSAQKKLAALEQLKDIAKILIKEETDFLELHQAIKSYRNLLDGIVDIDYEGIYENENIQFNNGFALGTSWAARCLDEIIRTKKFVRGLYLAILDLQYHANEPIQILYAGCGPFGTLVLPMFTLFSPAQIQVKVLEVNPLSLSLFKEVIQQLQFQDYIIDTCLADATKYQLAASESYDILLSETMQAALKQEQQVSIVLNLLQQLGEHCVLIPETIKLNLALTKCQVIKGDRNYIDMEWKILKMGEFFVLSRNSLKDHQIDLWDMEEYQFSEHTYPIPYHELDRYDYLSILTEITVYAKETLQLYSNSLTAPINLYRIDNDLKERKQVQVYYEVNENPGVRYQLI